MPDAVSNAHTDPCYIQLPKGKDHIFSIASFFQVRIERNIKANDRKIGSNGKQKEWRKNFDFHHILYLLGQSLLTGPRVLFANER